MSAIKTALLVLLCAVDIALGIWLAQVFISTATTSAVARILSWENAAYVLLTALLLVVPVLCWHIRPRASLGVRLVLAAAPIAVFLALGGKLWVRLV